MITYLPDTPFHVYFLDHHGQIRPKRIYIVTRRRGLAENMGTELYITELSRYILFDENRVVVVSNFSVN